MMLVTASICLVFCAVASAEEDSKLDLAIAQQQDSLSFGQPQQAAAFGQQQDAPFGQQQQGLAFGQQGFQGPQLSQLSQLGGGFPNQQAFLGQQPQFAIQPQAPPAPEFNDCGDRNWLEEEVCWRNFDTVIQSVNGSFPQPIPNPPPAQGATKEQLAAFMALFEESQKKAEAFKQIMVDVCTDRTVTNEDGSTEEVKGIITLIDEHSAAKGITDDAQKRCCNLKCHCKALSEGTGEKTCGGLALPRGLGLSGGFPPRGQAFPQALGGQQQQIFQQG